MLPIALLGLLVYGLNTHNQTLVKISFIGISVCGVLVLIYLLTGGDRNGNSGQGL